MGEFRELGLINATRTAVQADDDAKVPIYRAYQWWEAKQRWVFNGWVDEWWVKQWEQQIEADESRKSPGNRSEVE